MQIKPYFSNRIRFKSFQMISKRIPASHRINHYLSPCKLRFVTASYTLPVPTERDGHLVLQLWDRWLVDETFDYVQVIAPKSLLFAMRAIWPDGMRGDKTMCELCDFGNHSHTLHSLTGCDGAAGLESDGSCKSIGDQFNLVTVTS
jgi:hypothetical protein